MTPAVAVVEGTARVLARWDRMRVSRALGDVELDRARGFRHPADADDFVAAHLVAREAVGIAVGADPAAIRLASTCAECGSDRHGAPYVVGLAGLSVSLAHTRGAVAAAAGSRRLGIDVESWAGRGFDLVGELVLTSAERRVVATSADPDRAFLLFWVCKEALVKAGAAALDTLDAVELATWVPDRSEPLGPAASWQGFDLITSTGDVPGAGELVAAVATREALTWRPDWSGALVEPSGDRST